MLLTEEDKLQGRKQDIVVLVLRFLADYGYNSSYAALCAESCTSLQQADAADNVDLMTIVQEFVDYYYSRFGRYPKLIRRHVQHAQLADAPKRQDQINDDDHQHHLTKNAQVSMQQQAEQGAQCQPEERQSPQHHCSHQQQQQQLHHHLQLHHNQQQHSISPQVGVSGRQLQQQVMQQLQFQQILRLQCSPQQQVPALLQQPAGVTVLQRPNTQLLLSKQQPCQLYTAHMPSLQAGMSTALTANMQAPAGLGVSSSLVSPGMRVLVAAPPCAAPALLPATDTASNFNSSSKTLAPALRQAAEQQSLDVQQQQQQQQQLVPAASAEGVRLNGNAEGGMSTAQGCTCKLGSHQALTQEGYVEVLRGAPPDDLPSKYLSYRQPVTRTRQAHKSGECYRSKRLNTSSMQEEVLYALVGCSDVGWSCRKITKETRAFLQSQYGIQPSDITLFFKNRSVRSKPYSPTLELEKQRLKQRQCRAGILARVSGSRRGSGSSRSTKGRQQQQHSGSSNNNDLAVSSSKGSVPPGGHPGTFAALVQAGCSRHAAAIAAAAAADAEAAARSATAEATAAAALQPALWAVQHESRSACGPSAFAAAATTGPVPISGSEQVAQDCDASFVAVAGTAVQGGSLPYRLSSFDAAATDAAAASVLLDCGDVFDVYQLGMDSDSLLDSDCEAGLDAGLQGMAAAVMEVEDGEGSSGCRFSS